MNKYFLCLVIILFFITVEAQAASTLATAGTSGQVCRDFSVATVATVISSGDIVFCLNTDGPTPTSTSKFQLSAIIMTPQLGTNPAVTFTVTVKSSSCTFGTANTAGTLLTGAFGTESSSTWEVTMTSNICHGYIEGKVVSNTVTVFDDLFAFDIESSDYTTYVDNLNRFCNNSAFNADCDRPYVNIGQWPRLQTNSQSDAAGEVQFTANGPLIQLPDIGSVTIPLLIEALAPPSVIGATAISIGPLVDAVRGGNAICTVSGSFLAANSGVLTDGSKKFQYSRSVTIDADYCHISGTATLSTAGAPAGQVIFNWIFTRNVERLAGQLNNVISGSLDLTGTINVVNSGGQTVSISSWPTLLSTLSGGLTITDDADGWIIHQDALSGIVNVVNSGGQSIEVTDWPTLIATLSGDLNIHQDEACGAVTPCQIDCINSSCMTDVSNITNNVGNVTTSNNVKLNFDSFPLLLIAIAFFAVMGESRKDSLYWFVCTILSIYLLINRGDSIIPVGIYVGWIFVTLYQAVSILANKKAPRVDGEE